ncbi:MAG: DUF2868 domain-containing protein [Verrucomicrobia bacterium]|nr:DUF2868 domain-containing protein [Verrucomicrobiota bacterium]
MSASRPSRLGYLVDLAVQLQRDAGQPEAVLHRRERALARALVPWPRDRRALLAGWLDVLRRTEPILPGRQAGMAYRVVLLGLALLGLGIGWGAAAAVFYYDGSRPVNVIHVLAVMVGAQLVLLVLLGIVLLPRRWLRHVPGAVAIQEALAWFSPGQVVRLAWKRLPHDFYEPLRATLPQHAGNPWLAGRVRKWVIVFAAQSFAVAFNVGALAAALYLVTFSDLAFAWSTTLQPDVAVAHRLTRVLSAPWGWAAPEAVPSPELVRQTLYYRQSGPPGGASPARWGEWWPFLVAALATYGLLPRVLLLGAAGWRLHAAVGRAFVEAPGAAVVVDRLNSALVSTQARDAEAGGAAGRSLEQGVGGGAGGGTDAAGDAAVAGAGAVCVINWGGVEVDDGVLQERIRESWRRPVAGLFHAGGRMAVEADAQTIAHVAALPDQPAVALLVKSWEPPVLDVADFLHDLRGALGAARPVLVVPVALDEAGRLRAPRDADAVQWRKQVRGLGDAAFVVRPWTEGGAE